MKSRNKFNASRRKKKSKIHKNKDLKGVSAIMVMIELAQHGLNNIEDHYLFLTNVARKMLLYSPFI